MAFLKRGEFSSDARGGVAITYALSVVAMVGVAGLALDYTHAVTKRQEMQVGADAAALTAARASGVTTAEREALADSIFLANVKGMPASAVTGSTNLSFSDGRYTYSAQYTKSNFIMPILGAKDVQLGVSSEVAVQTVNREFVIAFDTTSSIVFTPSDYEQAQEAVKTMIDRFYEGAESPGDVVGTLMPFSDRVQLGDIGESFASGPPPSGWDGCLESREQPLGPESHRLTDDPPAVKRFDYFEDTLLEEHPAQGSRTYTIRCHGVEMTGPETSNPEVLKTGVEDLVIGGTGRFDVAMAWAWRILSPRWVNMWGVTDYPGPADEREKIVVFVSDGRTEIYRYEVLPPSGQHNVYGWNQGSPEGFDNLEAVCTRMKDEGIILFVIALPGNPNALPHLEDCASDFGYFEVTDVDGFESALGTVGDIVAEIRLTK
ncbi:MAG: pilus assembly protein TadG-related protein [Pseudomonadota bacterium]